MDMNEWIRLAAGRFTATDATQEDTPKSLPKAHAGAGANSPGVGVPKVSMTDVIRAAHNGGRKTWTTYK